MTQERDSDLNLAKKYRDRAESLQAMSVNMVRQAFYMAQVAEGYIDLAEKLERRWK